DLSRAAAEVLKGIECGNSGRYAGASFRRPRTTAFWSRDGQHAIVVNARVTQASDATAADASSSGSASLIEYVAASGRSRVLEPLVDMSRGVARHVSAVDWLKPG